MNPFGPAYDASLDGPRLEKQHEAIKRYMLAAGWKTLGEIHAALGYPEASISSQLRHLRKAEFGGFKVERQKRTPTLWEYRVTSPFTGTGTQIDLIPNHRPAMWGH